MGYEGGFEMLTVALKVFVVAIMSPFKVYAVCIIIMFFLSLFCFETGFGTLNRK